MYFLFVVTLFEDALSDIGTSPKALHLLVFIGQMVNSVFLFKYMYPYKKIAIEFLMKKLNTMTLNI